MLHEERAIALSREAFALCDDNADLEKQSASLHDDFRRALSGFGNEYPTLIEKQRHAVEDRLGAFSVDAQKVLETSPEEASLNDQIVASLRAECNAAHADVDKLKKDMFFASNKYTVIFNSSTRSFTSTSSSS